MVALWCLASAALAAPTLIAQRPLSFTEQLEAYDRGEYDSVARDLSRRAAEIGRQGEKPTSVDLAGFTDAATRWIQSGASQADRRRWIAAVVALEITHARRVTGAPPFLPFVAWACSLIREPPTRGPSEVERRWFEASLSATEESGGWRMLSPAPGPFSKADPAADLERQEGATGHLAHLRAALGDDPRLDLAAVELQDVETSGRALRQALFSVRPGVFSQAQLRTDEMPPALLAELRRRAAPPDNRSLDQRLARAAIQRWDSLPTVAERYRALSSKNAVWAEAELRLGYVEVRLGNWNAAVASFVDIPRITSDALLIYWSHYLRAWALEHAGQPDQAIEAYRAALAERPGVQAPTSRLGALLFLGDQVADREDAYRLLEAEVALDPVPPDPWLEYWEGDGRLWAERIGRLREALPR